MRRCGAGETNHHTTTTRGTMTKERTEDRPAPTTEATIAIVAALAALVALVAMSLAYRAWQNDLDRKAFLECVRTVEASPTKYATVFSCTIR